MKEHVIVITKETERLRQARYLANGKTHEWILLRSDELDEYEFKEWRCTKCGFVGWSREAENKPDYSVVSCSKYMMLRALE
jgi:hypothetical protein